MRPSHRLLAGAVCLAAACAPAATPASRGAIDDAESLVAAMHARYDGRWYRTLTFTQRTVRTPPNAPASEETWLEYGSMPGKLRIEMGPAAEQRGAIYAGDSLFIIRGGQVAARRADRNELMTLGFDVYTQPVAATLQQMREEGFDLTRFHRNTWQDRPAYVVGAAEGDERSKQFWIDAERLVFVRMLEPVPGDSTRVQDVRFNRYRPEGGGWIAPEVEVLVGGQRVFFEEYSDVRTGMALDPSLFDPDRWTQAVHPR